MMINYIYLWLAFRKRMHRPFKGIVKAKSWKHSRYTLALKQNALWYKRYGAREEITKSLTI